MYLAFYGQDYQYKNKLEKAIQHYLDNIDRTIVDDEDFNGFKTKIISDLKKLNEKYPRCTPKDPHLCSSGTKNVLDLMISGIDCVAFYFYFIDKSY
ncbi:hypothetical protein [Elizabethkingia miricola]|uniref:hypothetical protein n=1 Tax=Elizabethkingia miricola TaxID=172045 RepID=UPI00099A47F7|nr:hypothetical protein [Elizabethkingia miricola]OPC34600.1 hypothetical protein BAX99_06955 [Elizabethkingia miricola]